MIVQIKVRDEEGRYKDACPGDFAIAALQQIYQLGRGPSESLHLGWPWMRDWLCRFCLQRAETAHGNHNVADKWIERYRALRSIG